MLDIWLNWELLEIDRVDCVSSLGFSSLDRILIMLVAMLVNLRPARTYPKALR